MTNWLTARALEVLRIANRCVLAHHGQTLAEVLGEFPDNAEAQEAVRFLESQGIGDERLVRN